MPLIHLGIYSVSFSSVDSQVHADSTANKSV